MAINYCTVDFAISKGNINVSPLKTINDLSSDHLPISFSIDFHFNAPSIQKKFDYSKANWRHFRSIIEKLTVNLNSNYSNLTSILAIDKCIKYMSEGVLDAALNSIPSKTPSGLRYNYSEKIHNLTRYRNYYRNKFKNTSDPTYKSLVNQLNRLIKSETSLLSNNKFERKIASLNPHDLSLFQFSKSLKNKKISTPPLILNNSVAYSNNEKAEFLAQSFLDCHRTTLAIKSNMESNVCRTYREIKQKKNNFPVNEFIRVEQIIEKIKYLKIHKAPGEDKISNLIIKNLPVNFLKFLTNVFNSCLKIFYFPSKWKYGKIVAIPKLGKDQSNPKNYRPISLLSNFGKIFERIILNRLIDFENENEIFIPQQFGFRSNHSTVQQILRITEFATRNFNLNKSTGLVLLDIEKAFDSVWHEGLIYKLNKLKFPLHYIKMIQSFLSDRKAFVEIEGHSSEAFEIPAGVPQGSLLSPFLFNIFVNDLPKINNCHLAAYADDLAVFCEAPWRDLDSIKNTLKFGLVKISEFYEKWKIKINNTKTEFSIFTRSTKMKTNMRSSFPQFNNIQFNWSDPIKYLGIHLDSRLCFKNHIENSISKTNQAIRVLYCLLKKNNSSSINSKLTLYKSYIRPLLTYACPIFANCPNCHFKKLQIIQNKCLRMILSAPYYFRIDVMHEELKIPTIRQFVDKITDKFYTKCSFHQNSLVRSLGDYNQQSLPFRVKHAMPRKI